jgi:hypothetical protein
MEAQLEEEESLAVQPDKLYPDSDQRTNLASHKLNLLQTPKNHFFFAPVT